MHQYLKNSHIFIWILGSLILLNLTNSSSFAASKKETAANEIVFSIPRGEGGVHYANQGSEEGINWGPTALTVAPDGTFWIADSSDHSVLQYSSEGILLAKISTEGVVVNAGDIRVTVEGIWIFDRTSDPLKVVLLSFSGKTKRIYNISESETIGNGISGLTLGVDGNVLLKYFDNHGLTLLDPYSDKVDNKIIEGLEFHGKLYLTRLADRRYEKPSFGIILLGKRIININTDNYLAGLDILHINSDGSFLVEVNEMVLNESVHVDQKVYQYNSSGIINGMARVPLDTQYIPVPHSVAVSPDGEVFVLVTKSDRVEVQRLIFNTELPPFPYVQKTSPVDNSPQTINSPSVSCRSRNAILSVAYSYYNNRTYLSSTNINGNISCNDRTKPYYLSYRGEYSSIPYAYGQADTVAQFNNLMMMNVYLAGDADSTDAGGCARGVDCSGFVSRVWGFSYHHGTSLLASSSDSNPVINILDVQPGDIFIRTMNSSHVLVVKNFIYQGNSWPVGIKSIEATTVGDTDRVVMLDWLWSQLNSYSPRSLLNVCPGLFQSLVYLPLTSKNGSISGTGCASSEPYPAPDSISATSSTSTPKPYP